MHKIKFSTLESITLESVTSVGNYAFSNCGALAKVVIGGGVKTIESYAFCNCNSLTNIEATQGNANYKSIDGNLYSKDGHTLIQYAIGKPESTFEILEAVTIISEQAFANCKALAELTVPDSVTMIERGAFEGCYGLSKLVLPFVGTTKNATENQFFAYIFGASVYNAYYTGVPASLQTVVIKDGDIGAYAFYNCKNIKSITFTGATKIGESAFYGCAGISSINIPTGITSIGGDAFNGCSLLNSVVLPNGLTSISSGTFANCSSLSKISIPSSVTSVLWGAFSGTALPVVNGVRYADNWAVSCEDKSSITSVSLKAGTVGIAHSTFSDCASLTTVTLNSGLKYILADAFQRCSALQKISIPNSVINLGALFEILSHIFLT